MRAEIERFPGKGHLLMVALETDDEDEFRACLDRVQDAIANDNGVYGFAEGMSAHDPVGGIVDVEFVCEATFDERGEFSGNTSVIVEQAR